MGKALYQGLTEILKKAGILMELQIQNLKRTYEGKVALDIPRLQIPSGSFIGIIGPNGAGKSTFVKLLAGIDPLSRGKVLYNQKKLHNNSEVYQQVTLIFQKPYLFRTSVYDNIAYPLKIRGEKPAVIKEKVEALLEALDLVSLRNQPGKTLSGGEAQKVALARALVFEPELLLLDEPTANIDPQSIMVMERVLRDFYEKKGPTVIMVTHNIQQAKRLSKEVFFIDQGQLIEQGPTAKVLEHPQQPLTKNFIRWATI